MSKSTSSETIHSRSAHFDPPNPVVKDVQFTDYMVLGPVQFLQVHNDGKPYTVELNLSVREVIVSWKHPSGTETWHIPFERVAAYRLVQS